MKQSLFTPTNCVIALLLVVGCAYMLRRSPNSDVRPSYDAPTVAHNEGNPLETAQESVASVDKPVQSEEVSQA